MALDGLSGHRHQYESSRHDLSHHRFLSDTRGQWEANCCGDRCRVSANHRGDYHCSWILMFVCVFRSEVSTCCTTKNGFIAFSWAIVGWGRMYVETVQSRRSSFQLRSEYSVVFTLRNRCGLTLLPDWALPRQRGCRWHVPRAKTYLMQLAVIYFSVVNFVVTST